MKISWKIFIVTYCIILLSTTVGGALLVNGMHQKDLKAAMDAAHKDNETIYAYIMMMSKLEEDTYQEYSLSSLKQQMERDEGKKIFIGNYMEWNNVLQAEWDADLESSEIRSGIIETNGGTIIRVTSRYDQQYIINEYDITNIYEQRNNNYIMYRNVILAFSVIIAIVLYLFSNMITKPIADVTQMAEKIAEGDYSQRIQTNWKAMKSYEAEKLGETLNLLAQNTEDYIETLQDENRKKEEFMGNFAHELKTPMTSIIGYADLLRTYDLEPEKRRKYADFIYKEGKRLEQLSLNLLQLFVTDKTDFEQKELQTSLLEKEIKERVCFLAEKYQLEITVAFEKSAIYTEQVLLMSALLNLIDNACKASKAGQKVTVTGALNSEYYEFRIADQGCGISKDEIAKLLEPFYMVDKSRAREQGGAGLGLTLCNKIAVLHGGSLQIESELGKGTTVILQIKIGGHNNEEL